MVRAPIASEAGTASRVMAKATSEQSFEDYREYKENIEMVRGW